MTVTGGSAVVVVLVVVLACNGSGNLVPRVSHLPASWSERRETLV